MIRPATSSDAERVFHLLCCAQGAQRPYGEFAETFAGRLASPDEACLVAEEADGTVWGFIALRATDPTDAHDPMAISELIVASRMRGMQAHLIARAYRLVHALRHCARTLVHRSPSEAPQLRIA